MNELWKNVVAETIFTDKDHWFDMSYPFSPIPTDPVVLNMPVVPLADKVVYYAIGTKGLQTNFVFLFFCLSSLLMF
jgi:hypothetical protein